MKNLIFMLILIFYSTLLFTQVNFELDFSFQKIDPDDELTNLQLFDYNYDGNDEILGSFNGQNYCKIVCYSQNGDTLNTYTQQMNNDELLGRSYAFYGQNNEKILILVFYDYGNGFNIKFIDYDSFTICDSLFYDIGEPYVVVEVNHIIVPSLGPDNILYIGIDRFLGSVQEEVVNTMTYKFNYLNNQIEFLQEINDYGSHFIKYSDYDYIIASGEFDLGGNTGAWSYGNRSYNLSLLSNDYISNIQPVFSTSGSVIWSEPPEFSHFPSNYRIISLNDNNYMNYGTIIYYRSTDSITGVTNHYKCYDVDFSNLLWERNDSFISSSYISTSTCISVNNEEHYVMYFRGNQLEIRDRINGNIIHHQNSSISPFTIERNSDGVLLFFVEQEDETGYDVYVLEDEIQVSADNIQLPMTSFQLSNYPNPFNPETTINFSIEQNQQNKFVEIEIYNIKGQKVKDLFPSLCHPELVEGRGETQHSVIWNGIDQNNDPVSAGIYFYQLKVDGEARQTQKMLLMK